MTFGEMVHKTNVVNGDHFQESRQKQVYFTFYYENYFVKNNGDIVRGMIMVFARFYLRIRQETFLIFLTVY